MTNQTIGFKVLTMGKVKVQPETVMSISSIQRKDSLAPNYPPSTAVSLLLRCRRASNKSQLLGTEKGILSAYLQPRLFQLSGLGSQGNVPQKMKNLFVIYVCLNCTLENEPTVRNILSFYNKFFICGTLPSDPPNFIKLL
jgi:hypothetical protein